MTNSDQKFIHQTFKLAKKSQGNTFPNPMVGSIIVKNNIVIGSGFHKKAGLPHAEVEAFKSLKISPQGATLYVNLEPCSHTGQTGPCTDAIIKSGIARVVCAVEDPYPKVAGRGIKQLKNSGIEVTCGILENEAVLLNEAFFTFHKKKRPFVALKFGASLDGKIATKTEDSKWITNDKARCYAHVLRSIHQSILVGINTVIMDDPHLGSRIKGKNDPLRIIIDPSLKIPMKAQVLRDSNVLIVTTKNADLEKQSKIEKMGIDLISFETQKIIISELLSELTKREIVSVLVEGGGQTLGYFADSKLFDVVYAFHAPLIIGGNDAISAIGGQGIDKVSQAIKFNSIAYKKLGDNLLTIARV